MQDQTRYFRAKGFATFMSVSFLMGAGTLLAGPAGFFSAFAVFALSSMGATVYQCSMYGDSNKREFNAVAAKIKKGIGERCKIRFLQKQGALKGLYQTAARPVAYAGIFSALMLDYMILSARIMISPLAALTGTRRVLWPEKPKLFRALHTARYLTYKSGVSSPHTADLKFMNAGRLRLR